MTDKVRVFTSTPNNMMDKLPPPLPLFSKRTRFTLACLVGSLHWLLCAFALIAQTIMTLSNAGLMWLAARGFVPACLLALAGTFLAYWGDRTAPSGERTDPWAFVIAVVGIASALPLVLPWLPLFFRDFAD